MVVVEHGLEACEGPVGNAAAFADGDGAVDVTVAAEAAFAGPDGSVVKVLPVLRPIPVPWE